MSYEQIARAIVEEAIDTDPGVAAGGCGRPPQRLEQQRAERARSIPRSRAERLVESRRRLEE